jgi:hypothetical protein
MATIRKELTLETPTAKVWEALKDFHAIDKRVAPGFVVKSVPDGSARVITFSNGTVAREELVSADDAIRRLVYAICGNERFKHYQGATQVFADSEKRCRFVWTVDVLPDAMAGHINEQMDFAVGVMKPALEKA